MATYTAEPLTTGNISHAFAAVHEVLKSIALHTPTNCHCELKLDTPIEEHPANGARSGVEQMCQTGL